MSTRFCLSSLRFFYLLLSFCSKNLDVSGPRIAHFDFSLITLFVTVMVICFEPILLFSFDGNNFLTVNFKTFDFIELIDLNSSCNILLEIFSIKDFLVE